MLNINTVRNVEIDFLLGCFFREDVTQNRNSGDVVRPEVAFTFARITVLQERKKIKMDLKN